MEPLGLGCSHTVSQVVQACSLGFRMQTDCLSFRAPNSENAHRSLLGGCAV